MGLVRKWMVELGLEFESGLGRVSDSNGQLVNHHKMRRIEFEDDSQQRQMLLVLASKGSYDNLHSGGR